MVDEIEKKSRKKKKKSKSNTMLVVPTIARLKRVVKGSHENGEHEEEEEIAVTKFVGPIAEIEVRQRLTTSYGGDWVQIGVSLSLPCYPEEIEDGYNFADEWVTDKIRSEVANFDSSVSPDTAQTKEVVYVTNSQLKEDSNRRVKESEKKLANVRDSTGKKQDDLGDFGI